MKSAARINPSWQAGFTLVEVAVSLAVLSLILLATVTALRTFANTQRTLEQVSGRLDEVRSVSRFLREGLEASITGEMSGGLTLGGASMQPAHFILVDNALEWKAPMLFGEGYGGVFLLRVGREGEDVVMRWREPALSVRTAPWEEMPAKVLIHGVEHFEISVRPEFGEAWVSVWDAVEPPAVVRLQIRTRGRFWPELIVQVQR